MQEKASAFGESYGAILGELEANPNADLPQMGGQPISCISLCALR